MASTISKLRLPKAPARLLMLNAPKGYINTLEVSDDYDVLETIKGTFEWAQLFAHDAAELEKLLPKVYAACTDKAMIWMCYPKGSSGKQTTLTRDKGWDILKTLPGQWLTLISINDDWSGFAMRKGAEGSKEATASMLTGKSGSNQEKYKPWVDNEKRVITLPDDLKKALNTNKQVKAFFEGLAYSHKREYVIYILDAKKPETRAARIDKTIARLAEGKKNLTV